jgi:hypothetical protein
MLKKNLYYPLDVTKLQDTVSNFPSKNFANEQYVFTYKAIETKN